MPRSYYWLESHVARKLYLGGVKPSYFPGEVYLRGLMPMCILKPFLREIDQQWKLRLGFAARLGIEAPKHVLLFDTVTGLVEEVKASTVESESRRSGQTTEAVLTRLGKGDWVAP